MTGFGGAQPVFAAAGVALLVAAGALADSRWRAAGPSESAAPARATDADEVAADAAFESVRQAISTAQAAPRGEREEAFAQVSAACEAFLEAHGSAATSDQLSVAGHYWLQLTEEQNAIGPQARALQLLGELEDLPPELERASDLQAARLRTRPGELAPAWSVQGLAGRVASSEQSGLVLLSFWAKWNPHCRDLLQQRLAPLARRGPGLTLIHVGVPGNGETLVEQRAHLESIRCAGVATFDSDGSCGRAFGVNGTPFLCLIGSDGRVLARGSGLAIISAVEARVAPR